MTDRSRRRTAASDSAEGAPREDNPFAAPPEGSPDQPWQPRHTGGDRGGPNAPGEPGGSHDAGQQPGSDSDSGEGADSGTGEESGTGEGSGPEQTSGDDGPSWGSRWSSRQPGRGSGGFGQGRSPGQDQGGGDRQGGDDGFGGPGGGGGPGGSRGLRWDPTDPLQRHARYSFYAGVWALVFGFNVPEVALLLSALSLYWGIHSLRGGSKDSGKGGRSGGRATAEDVAGTDRTSQDGDTTPASAPSTSPASPASSESQAASIPVTGTPEQRARSQRNAAIGGLVLAALALAVVAATFAFHMVYQDYFACTQDALTQPSREECTQLLPSELRPFLQGG